MPDIVSPLDGIQSPLDMMRAGASPTPPGPTNGLVWGASNYLIWGSGSYLTWG